METIPYVYTTRDEMVAIFGSFAIDVRVDDDESGEPASAIEDSWIDAAIEEATDEINIFCNRYYAASALAESLWVRRRAAYLAIHILSQRRGNPDQYSGKATQIRMELERVKKGQFYIPRVAYRSDQSPAMINTVVDHRYPRSKIRVQTDQSVSGNDEHINVDHPFYVDGW